MLDLVESADIYLEQTRWMGKGGGVAQIDHSTGGYFLTFPESKRVNKGIERMVFETKLYMRAGQIHCVQETVLFLTI